MASIAAFDGQTVVDVEMGGFEASDKLSPSVASTRALSEASTAVRISYTPRRITAPFTLQDLKNAQLTLGGMFVEQKKLLKFFAASHTASDAVEETIKKIAQRLRKIDGDLKIAINRFVVSGKTSSTDTTDGKNPAPLKDYFVQLESNLSRERNEMHRLSDVILMGDTTMDDERLDEHEQRMAKIREEERGTHTRVASRETRLAASKHISYREQIEPAKPATKISHSQKLNKTAQQPKIVAITLPAVYKAQPKARRPEKRTRVEETHGDSSDSEPKLSGRQKKKRRLAALQLTVQDQLLCSRNNHMLPKRSFDCKPDGSYYKCCRECKGKLDASRAAEKKRH